MLAGLSGEVLDVGVGDGLAFAHYSTAVTRVSAVEPEPRLRALARAAAERAPIPVEVTAGTAESLTAKTEGLDAVVCSLVLCTVPNPAAALAETFRVLRPGGRLHFLEHVRAETPGMARVQRLLDATIWPHMLGGCHTGRDTLTAITEAGFALEETEHFLFPPARTPFSRHVRGTAIRPSSGSG